MAKIWDKIKFPPGGSLERCFWTILIKSKFTTLSMENILELLGGKGKPLLLILLSLPFCQPIPLPGLSILFGIVIIFLGIRIAIDGKIWLPKAILHKQISRKTLHQISSKGLWLVKKIKRFIRPRLLWLCRSQLMRLTNGILIALLGFLLALPVPIPLANLLAAWPILLLSIGLAEDDGVFILVAYAITGICFFSFIYAGLKLF